ncbi:MAG: ATP-binding cassette domain-containing protein, partial [Bacteroidota bacterium]
MGKIAVDFLNVSFGYNPPQLVLRGVNFSIQKSVVTAIVGKSGSGKSTLLQLVNGMLRPTEGEVRLQGRSIDYRNVHEERLRIGYVVQHIGLFPHLTISKNIDILGNVAKRPKAEVTKRAREL